MYTEHGMEILTFEENDVFIRAGLYYGGHGESEWSIKPDRSDS